MAAPSPRTSFLATRRGKLTLALLCAVAFLDFVDASIVNVALPSIRRDLDGRIVAIDILADPDRLRQLDLGEFDG